MFIIKFFGKVLALVSDRKVRTVRIYGKTTV